MQSIHIVEIALSMPPPNRTPYTTILYVLENSFKESSGMWGTYEKKIFGGVRSSSQRTSVSNQKWCAISKKTRKCGVSRAQETMVELCGVIWNDALESRSQESLGVPAKSVEGRA